jgi:hypothetical protein
MDKPGNRSAAGLLCEAEEGTGWKKGTADERARPVSEKREGRWKWASAGMLGWNRKWACGDEVGLRWRGELGHGLEKGKGREREFGEVFLLNFFFKPLFFFKKILLQTFKTSKLLSNFQTEL